MRKYLKPDFKFGILSKVSIITLIACLLFTLLLYLLSRNSINPLNLRSFIPDELLISPLEDLTSLSEVAKIKSLRADALRNIVWAFGSSLGLFLALIGVVNSIHRTQQKDQEIANQKASEKAERRVADSNLFSNGVTKLGSPEPEIQVGGLYELEFLAREDSVYDETDNFLPLSIKSTIANFIKLKSLLSDAYKRSAIQTAAIVLSRTFSNIPNSFDTDESRPQETDLLNLRGAVFKDFAFPSDIDFSNVDLTNANFENCKLIGSRFEGSNLNQVNFKNADLTRSNITNADATDANFDSSVLTKVNFSNTRGIDYSSIVKSSASLDTTEGLNADVLQNASSELKNQRKINEYLSDIHLYIKDVDEVALKGIVKSLGVALFNRDASLIACSDESERSSIANGFVLKKLGVAIKEGNKLVEEVCQMMKSQRFKSRVTFYYLLAMKTGNLHLFHK